MITELYTLHPEPHRVAIPVYTSAVPAGFPSPADDYLETKLDLNDLLVHDPLATFMVRVSGDSMIGAGIASGDVLVIDRGIEPANGHIVLAIVDGEFTVKRLQRLGNQVSLVPENPAYAPIQLQEGQELQIWGVATGCVKAFL